MTGKHAIHTPTTAKAAKAVPKAVPKVAKAAKAIPKVAKAVAKKPPTVPKVAKAVAKKPLKDAKVAKPAKAIPKKPPTVPKVAKPAKAVAKKPPKVPKVAKTVAKKPLKDAKVAKAIPKKPPTVPKTTKATKAIAKKPPTVPKVAKVAKAIPKKPLKDAKATRATKAVAKKPPTVPKATKATKAVAKKPPTVPKATKATKAVAKKPLKDANVAKVAKAAKPSNATKTVVKKSKKQIYRGGCFGYFCPSKVEDESMQQPLTQLEERINRMGIVKRYLKENAYDNECVIEREGGLYIKDLQLIIKDLGEYVDTKKNILTTNIDGNNVVIKLIERSDELEINIMVAIRDHIISKNISKHFLIIYFNSLCDDTTIPYPPLIIYNESVENSLNHILYNLNDDDDTFHNLLIQSLLSIGSYHNLTGYVHMDTHTGNFLYAENSEHNPEGYYQYSFGNETYYLKSCGYNVMIYDFGDSNKIDIPIDKIKRFELFYENDNYEVARSYIVKGGLYKIVKQNGSFNIYEPDDDLNLTVREGKSYGTNEGNTFNYDDILYIYKMFVDIENNANYYRMKILIDDYYIFIKRVSEIFVRGKRSALIGEIKDEIEKIKGDYDYLKKQPTITDAQFYGYAKDIFKRVLDICITHFPNIFSKKETKSMLSTFFSKQQPIPQTILNNPPYLLYQQTKITVEEPTITQ